MLIPISAIIKISLLFLVEITYPSLMHDYAVSVTPKENIKLELCLDSM